MEIGPQSDAKIQIEEREPVPVEHVLIERDVLQSRLVEVTGVDGEPIDLPVGARVTLYKGPAVVFVGLVDQDRIVIDMLSAESDDSGEFEEI
jgi:hypothetical protein